MPVEQKFTVSGGQGEFMYICYLMTQFNPARYVKVIWFVIEKETDAVLIHKLMKYPAISFPVL